MIDYEDDLSIAMREMEETKEAMTEQEITQAHADISQLDIEQLRCGVMQQLLKIEALTKERNDAVYACGLVVQRCDGLVIERDALAAAADSILAQQVAAPDVQSTLFLTPDSATDIINDHLHGLYVCTRVWEAWNVGTMTEDDFVPASQTDFTHDLSADLVAKLVLGAASPPTQQVALPAGCVPMTPVEIIRAVRKVESIWNLIRQDDVTAFVRAIEAHHKIGAKQ